MILFSTHEDESTFGSGSLYKIWRKACADAKVKYMPVYQTSRHSMASQVVADAKKKALEETQDSLGHFNKTTAKKHYIMD